MAGGTLHVVTLRVVSTRKHENFQRLHLSSDKVLHSKPILTLTLARY